MPATWAPDTERTSLRTWVTVRSRGRETLYMYSIIGCEIRLSQMQQHALNTSWLDGLFQSCEHLGLSRHRLYDRDDRARALPQPQNWFAKSKGPIVLFLSLLFCAPVYCRSVFNVDTLFLHFLAIDLIKYALQYINEGVYLLLSVVVYERDADHTFVLLQTWFSLQSEYAWADKGESGRESLSPLSCKVRTQEDDKREKERREEKKKREKEKERDKRDREKGRLERWDGNTTKGEESKSDQVRCRSCSHTLHHSWCTHMTCCVRQRHMTTPESGRELKYSEMRETNKQTVKPLAIHLVQESEREKEREEQTWWQSHGYCTQRPPERKGPGPQGTHIWHTQHKRKAIEAVAMCATEKVKKTERSTWETRAIERVMETPVCTREKKEFLPDRVWMRWWALVTERRVHWDHIHAHLCQHARTSMSTTHTHTYGREKREKRGQYKSTHRMIRKNHGTQPHRQVIDRLANRWHTRILPFAC